MGLGEQQPGKKYLYGGDETISLTQEKGGGGHG